MLLLRMNEKNFLRGNTNSVCSQVCIPNTSVLNHSYFSFRKIKLYEVNFGPLKFTLVVTEQKWSRRPRRASRILPKISTESHLSLKLLFSPYPQLRCSLSATSKSNNEHFTRTEIQGYGVGFLLFVNQANRWLNHLILLILQLPMLGRSSSHFASYGAPDGFNDISPIISSF